LKYLPSSHVRPFFSKNGLISSCHLSPLRPFPHSPRIGNTHWHRLSSCGVASVNPLIFTIRRAQQTARSTSFAGRKETLEKITTISFREKKEKKKKKTDHGSTK
jgi:hypothetical protein